MTIPSVPKLLAHSGQTLSDHLNGVAKRARELAAHFGGERHAEIAGLLHDFGKADAEFQKRIQHSEGLSDVDGEKRPHAQQGAALALERQLWPIAFAVAGHHAGLHDRAGIQQLPFKRHLTPNERRTLLIELGETAVSEWPFTSADKTLPDWLEKLPLSSTAERSAKMRAVDFYTRMLFSALVDADRLDTEEANPAAGPQANALKRKAWRFGNKALAADGAIAQLQAQLDAIITERATRARENGASDAVLRVRSEVFDACRACAAGPRGVFSLTVPTGGGKTLASVAFALAHAKAHRLRRIVVVIPYLNIIQQTTKELKEVFAHSDADPVVLEHHSQASDPVIRGKDDGKKDSDADGWNRERPLRQLAAENWDAPIIVTTSVQFFDSLFSRRPADARKLHNLCQSVIIFDEVQTLPPLLLQPILDALQELAHPHRHYGCSLVLCTATLPALRNSDDLPFGFRQTTPVVPDDVATRHFRELKRVEYHGLNKESPPVTLSNDGLADALLRAPKIQALAILNTRKQARAVFDALRTKGTDGLRDAVFHLSTWMYPAHRLAVLAEVTQRLREGRPCLLVSTQCVEAGVDVDFPAVWRAFGPYDSIVQAAGRCNRHGALKDAAGKAAFGQVHVFTPEENGKPGGVYESAIQNADLLRKMGKAIPEDPNSFDLYFRLLYQTTVPDLGGCAIQAAREKLHFEQVSDLFNFIDADTVPVLIEHPDWTELPAPEGARPDRNFGEWLRARKRTRPATARNGDVFPADFLTRDEWRMLQRFVVNVSFPSSDRTKRFLREKACMVFADDDSRKALYRLIDSRCYSPEAGLDALEPSLQPLASI